jgi:hypothetical protein
MDEIKTLNNPEKSSTRFLRSGRRLGNDLRAGPATAGASSFDNFRNRILPAHHSI